MAATALILRLALVQGAVALQLQQRGLHPRSFARGHRCPAPRCVSDDPFSFAALRQEAERRGGESLGKFAAMRHFGPHHTTTPREVVQHIITELQQHNISQAFAFTAVPVLKRGTHKSSTDWSHRMSWEKAKVINDAPSGKACNADDFEAMVRSKYAPLLNVVQYRFVGDDSAWQQKNGHEKMTAVKDYVVEVRTRESEHLLLKFKLVYDWLVYCHLVASVRSISTLELSVHPLPLPLPSRSRSP